MLQRRACDTNFHMYFQHFEGLIHEGDELKEVNGISLEHRKPKEILTLLVSLTSYYFTNLYFYTQNACKFIKCDVLS